MMLMTGLQVRVTVIHGEVPTSDRRYLAEKIERAASMAPAAVLQADATISHLSNPAADRPVTVTALLDVNGRAIRAQVTAEQAREAADLLEARLQQQLEQLAGRRLARRHAPAEPTPGEWRHGMRPAPRPPFHPRPVEERDLVPRRTFAARPLKLEEAVDEMTLLDHDFHLFIEAATGADTLVERTDDGVRVSRAWPPAPGPEPQEMVPDMDVADAIQALEDGALPRLFFVERTSGRGAVVYHRYDGHYGLVTTAPAG
jgi:ribosome-associated translation inhibitor RaiA